MTAWEMVAGRPARRLHSVLTGYQGYAERAAGPVCRREVASVSAVLVFGFGDPLYTVPLDASARPSAVTAFVAGGGDTAFLTEHAGSQHGVEVVIAPLGVVPLLGVPASELTNRVVPLDDLWGARGRALHEQLGNATTWQERFDRLDAALLARLEQSASPDPTLVGAWRQLERTRGLAPIFTLLEQTGWSRGRLVSRFRKHVGMTPKTAAQLLRFARALRLLDDTAQRPPLVEIALTCGYYDQAHFNRDFRRFAGCSPLEHLSAKFPDLPGHAG